MKYPIKFTSTNLKSPGLPFNEALLKGQAPDKGLYMPALIPQVSTEELSKMSSMSYPQIANLIIGKFLKGVIPENVLIDLCKGAYNYEVPLEQVVDRKYVMRLDQGPTASFKDFAGRMMGRLMNYYLSTMDRELLILTATSGDTGSAIANAFYGFKNIKVLVLFPKDEVTPRQRKQMTTLGENVQIVGLDAKFDDCQTLVKQAFADPDLDNLNLSSANSINIGRLIPQSVYYFYAWSRLRNNDQEKAVFSVPSGNFGNMMGGMLAMKMGLPVSKFVIATNENDEFPMYLGTGEYHKIEPSRNCISSAMNVGHPSNLARLVAFYNGVMDEKGNIAKQANLELMNRELFAVSVSDNETKATIKNAWNNFKVLLEPHGAVGWKGLENFLHEKSDFDKPDQLCVSLETAHPAKFPEQIRELLNFDPDLPPSLEDLEEKQEQYDEMDNNFDAFKNYLIRKYHVE